MTDHRTQEISLRTGLGLTRRELLIGLAALGITACVPRGTGRGGAAFFGVRDPDPLPDVPDGLFALGVACGDPTPDGFVLWTRLAPEPVADAGGMPDRNVSVRWQIAEDPDFQLLAADGVVQTSSAVAHSVHVDVSGLEPDREYWYRFTTGGQVSSVGRSRTAPGVGAEVGHLRALLASCQHYEHGYYTAWSHAAADQPDLVVFLGDYIYEGGTSSNRPRQHNSPAVTTLDAYRKRYGLYKSDHRLQAAHAAAPWILTWDDHEVQNNYTAWIPQSGTGLEAFAARRVAAYQAYWEHQPIRVEPLDGVMPLHRSLRWGSLLDVHVLDGRQYRSTVACGADISVDCEERYDATRTMLGPEQMDWLTGQLDAEPATWSLLANQTVMSPMPIGTAFNMDQWDGFPVERSRLLDALTGVRNAVVATGDIHSAGIATLKDEPADSPAVGTEVVTTSISSNTTSQLTLVLPVILDQNPHIHWADPHHRGYARLDITSEHIDVDFVSTQTDTDELGPADIETSWRILDGIPGAQPR